MCLGGEYLEVALLTLTGQPILQTTLPQARNQ